MLATTPWAHRLRPRTLTTRLVLTAVMLVAVVGLLVSGATALAMSRYLTGQLDQQVHDSLTREQNHPPGPGDPPTGSCPANTGADDGARHREDPTPSLPPGQAGGTLTLRTQGGQVCAFVIEEDGDTRRLARREVDQLRAVPLDGQVHGVDLPRLGDYRVIAAAGGHSVLGLPSASVAHSVRQLLLWEAVLTLLGVGVAACLGDVLVRRQLRPLQAVADTAHQVTEQNLATGEPVLHTRVDPAHTDAATEVGRVGGALNTLLDHVDAALAERHRSEQRVRQFVADASHELRTPLATIQGYAELSRRTPEDAAALRGAMGKVETEAGRMRALVEDLLLLARLDSGRPLARDEVDLTRLVLEAVSDAQVVDAEHRWRLGLPEEPVTVVGDEQRLHQVVTNLLNNARAHTPPGTTVTATVGSTLQRAVVRVHDDGPGLSPDLAATAFERFTRGDSSRTRSSGGAGLGLSLVAAITRAHGGRAHVDSRPGSTTFTLDLPRG